MSVPLLNHSATGSADCLSARTASPCVRRVVCFESSHDPATLDRATKRQKRLGDCANFTLGSSDHGPPADPLYRSPRPAVRNRVSGIALSGQLGRESISSVESSLHRRSSRLRITASGGTPPSRAATADSEPADSHRGSARCPTGGFCRSRFFRLVALPSELHSGHVGQALLRNQPSRLSGTAAMDTNFYGQCEVSIPKQHQFGQLERPSIWRLEFRESKAKHVVLKNVEPLKSDDCLGRMRSDLSADDESALFVFIHGYNVTFSEAAQRTAQMAFDLQFRGVPLFYSWPSRGALSGYGDDQRSADASAKPLAEFLTRIATETGARKIHLIAHSLGNRALVGALAQLGQTPGQSARFNQVVFAAPDIDAGLFANDIAPKIEPVVDRVTIYSSGSDLALWASRLWHRTVRLGQPGPYWVKIRTYDWIDVIDATSIGFEWFELGHSAYGGELLADLSRVIDGQPAGAAPLIGPEAGHWIVTRPPPPSIPINNGPPLQVIYRYRPSGPWPTAPVDRWR